MANLTCKCFFGAGQNYGTDFLVGVELAEGVIELDEEGCAESIECFRAV